MKVCEYCGKVIENPGKGQKYHRDCAKKVNVENMKRHRDKARAEKVVEIKKKLNICDGNCKDCCHSSDSGGIRVCLYILDTGKRRPCPVGEGCTVKQVGRRKKGIVEIMAV